MAAIYACCAIPLPSLSLPLCMHRSMSNTASDDNHGKINSSVSFSFLQSMHNAYTGSMERDDDEVKSRIMCT